LLPQLLVYLLLDVFGFLAKVTKQGRGVFTKECRAEMLALSFGFLKPLT
jgi:hypothetical protein